MLLGIIMKETYYFSHDYEPTSDPKMQALIGEFGAIGYGIFWRIVEMLHSNPDHRLPKKRYINIAIAKQMLTSVEQVEAIFQYCINVCDLFIENDEFIYSERVNRNIEKRLEISELRSKAGHASAEKRKLLLTHVEQPLTHVEQNSTKESKLKEIKLKEIKLKESNSVEDNKHMCNSEPENTHTHEPIEKPVKAKRIKPEFIPPSQDEFTDYFKANGYKTDIALRAFKGYSESGWKDSQGKQVLNWKQKCQHVWFKPEHVIKNKPSEKTQAEVVEEYRKAGWNVVDY